MDIDFSPSEAHLGKFVSPTVLKLVLKNRSLRWSRPALFNDPFDCQPRFRFCPSVEECLPLLRQEISKLLSDDIKSFSVDSPFSREVNWIVSQINAGTAKPDVLNLFLEGVLDDATEDPKQFQNRFFDEVVGELHTSKIICFTKNYSSILMWSHYADSHRGALIGLAPRSTDSQFSLARPVNYISSLPYMMDALELAHAFTGQVSLGDDAQTRRTLDRAVFTKALEWQYEQEWRIMGGDGFRKDDDVEYNKFSLDDLSFVVLGCKADDDLVENCTMFRDEACQHLKIYRAQKAQDSFQVYFSKV